MIRVVFFDYDGVLTTDRTGSLTTCRYISATSGIPLDLVQRAFATHNRELTIGSMTYSQAWPQICSELDSLLSIDLLQDAFDSTPINSHVFELARRLRPACGVGIITDNKSDRMRRLRAVQSLDDLFDPIVVSADLGCSKDSESIFRHACALAGVEPRECVFIDNTPEHAARAASIGMHALHFDDGLNDVDALARRLTGEFGLPALQDS